MLRIVDLSFSYRQPPAGPAALVLNHLSAEIPAGQIVGLLGPNGSGKTTLMRVLCGTLQPRGGTVVLDGRPLTDYSRRELARRMALVPQETHLAFDYSVLEMVLMGRHPHLGVFAVEGPADLTIARDALHATGTDHLEARDFATLSGGEKQRVIIAAALAQAPHLLLLDEPTASLDLRYQLDVCALLRDLNRHRGITMVLSTHDLNIAAALCHQLILLRDGRIIATGSTADILTPDHIEALYDVEADVHLHEASGHLTVVPVARARRRRQ